MSTITTDTTKLNAFQRWVSENGRMPRMSSLDPAELSLARWLEGRRPEALAGTLDSGTARKLDSIPGTIPAGRRRSVTEWCTLVEGFMLDRGHLPSETSADDFELSLARAIEKAIIPALQRGPVSAFTPLESSLRELQDRAAQPKQPAPTAEMLRLSELKAYVREHGHLPARRSSLGWWSADRILTGSSPAPGVIDELVRLKADYPSHGKAKAIGWARAAAAHHAEHGVLLPLPWTAISRRQDSLRQLIEQYDLPDHLLPAIRLVLAEPDPYGKKWSAVLGDFTAWVDAHGSLPNRRSADPEEYRLANWLNVQRVNQRAGTLRPDLAERLGAVQGALTPRIRIRPTREDRIAQVMEFHAAAGRPPREGARDDAEHRLGKWLANRHRDIRNGKAAVADFGELANLPGVLTPPPPGTIPRPRTESAALVADFHAVHGHFPRRRSEDGEERRLAVWLGKTRMAIRAGRISASDLGGLAAIPGAVEVR